MQSLEQEEEAHRDNEKKKIKREAALFKRHWKHMQTRIRSLREVEDEKLQAEYLEASYQERRAQDAEDDLAWDPIEGVMNEKRERYLDLIRSFLWLEHSATSATSKTGAPTHGAKSTEQGSSPPGHDGSLKTPFNSTDETVKAQDLSKSSRAKAKKKLKQKEDVKADVGSVHIETPEEMRSRLKTGMKHQYSTGWHVTGAVENPNMAEKTPALHDEEINTLIEDIIEIKSLLFCRLLLRHATLLPVALRAENIEDFFNSPDVPDSELRDLALKVEQPALQEIRDACADLARTDEGEEGDESNLFIAKNDRQLRQRTPMIRGKRNMPDKWLSKRERNARKRQKAILEEENRGAIHDFAEVDDYAQHRIDDINVRICGKRIFKWPREKAMARGNCVSSLSSSCLASYHVDIEQSFISP